jgi:hypothetical protein
MVSKYNAYFEINFFRVIIWNYFQLNCSSMESIWIGNFHFTESSLKREFLSTKQFCAVELRGIARIE